MDIAALIIGTLALILGIVSMTLMLAKNFFSTHQVQMVPVNPGAMQDMLSPDIGSIMGNQYRDLGDPIDADELEHLENLRKKKAT